MHRLLSAGLIVSPCHAISLRLDRDTGDLDAGGACRDTAPGEWCHAAVSWAKESGHSEHPEWFPGDASQYSKGDFQALLHQFGEVNCKRPCAQTSLSLLETADSAAAKKGEAEADRFGFREAEFTAVMENIWAPKKARTGDAPVSTEKNYRDCQAAPAGSMCYHAVHWLKKSGIAKHPDWYPTLTPNSANKDVQAVLHTLRKADCPSFCEEATKTPESDPEDSDVIEIMDQGRKVKSEAVKIDEPSCGAAQPGEWCHQSILWLKNSGLQKHPDWYPDLSAQSSVEDFQMVLHTQGKVGCPRPCGEGETATATLPLRQGKDVVAELPVRESNLSDVLPAVDSAEEGQVRESNVSRGGMVKKRLADMSVKELAQYLDKQWDGFVDSSLYDPSDFFQSDHVAEVRDRYLSANDGPLSESNVSDEPAADTAKRARKGQGLAAEIASMNGENSCHKARTAKVGEMCFKAVSWAKLTGIVDHPEWYQGLTGASTFKEFQAYLHKKRGDLCDAPCSADAEPADEDVAASNMEATTVHEEETTASPVEEATAVVEEVPETTSAGPLPIDQDDAVPETSAAPLSPVALPRDGWDSGASGSPAPEEAPDTTNAPLPVDMDSMKAPETIEAAPDTTNAPLPVDMDSQKEPEMTGAAPLSSVDLPRDEWGFGVPVDGENASSQLVASSASRNVVDEEPLPYVHADGRLISVEEANSTAGEHENSFEDAAPAEVDVTAVEVSEDEATPTAVHQAATEEAVKIDVAVEATQEAAQADKEDEAEEARQEEEQKALESTSEAPNTTNPPLPIDMDSMKAFGSGEEGTADGDLEAEQAAAFGGGASEEQQAAAVERAEVDALETDAVEAVKIDVAIEATQEAAQVAKEEEADEKRQEAAQENQTEAEGAAPETGAVQENQTEADSAAQENQTETEENQTETVAVQEPRMLGSLGILRKLFR